MPFRVLNILYSLVDVIFAVIRAALFVFMHRSVDVNDFWSENFGLQKRFVFM